MQVSSGIWKVWFCGSHDVLVKLTKVYEDRYESMDWPEQNWKCREILWCELVVEMALTDLCDSSLEDATQIIRCGFSQTIVMIQNQCSWELMMRNAAGGELSHHEKFVRKKKAI
jgi:hypothetical protein